MISVEEAGALWKLSPTAELVGNPLAQALHGGAITAFLELACGAVLSHRLDRNCLPQLISINVQFLAPMRLARSRRSQICAGSGGASRSPTLMHGRIARTRLYVRHSANFCVNSPDADWSRRASISGV
ncbi:PaaI family thioesterase [Novosphingobium panipatense]